MVTIDIFPHHTRRCHARPYDGRSCNQCCIIIASQFVQQLPHGRRLNIKTTDGIRFPDLRFYFFIASEFSRIMDIISIPLFFFTRASVSLICPSPRWLRISNLLIPMSSAVNISMCTVAKSFWRHKHRAIVYDWFFGNDHTAGMDRWIDGEAQYHAAIL